MSSWCRKIPWTLGRVSIFWWHYTNRLQRFGRNTLLEFNRCPFDKSNWKSGAPYITWKDSKSHEPGPMSQRKKNVLSAVPRIIRGKKSPLSDVRQKCF